jgi:hypothetical protein
MSTVLVVDDRPLGRYMLEVLLTGPERSLVVGALRPSWVLHGEVHHLLAGREADDRRVPGRAGPCVPHAHHNEEPHVRPTIAIAIQRAADLDVIVRAVR